MRVLLSICLLLILSPHVQAQLLQGTVSDKETNKKIPVVMVVNQRTHAYTHTNDSGFYMLQAKAGDTLIYLSKTHNTLRAAVSKRVEDIKMVATTYSLDEVEILSDIARHEKEHEELLLMYDKTISDAKRKPKFHPNAGTSPGFTIDGAISGIAGRVSGKRKKDKGFLNSFEQLENEKYIALRYNPQSVMAATKTTYDSAVAFINANPADIELVRDASYIEFTMWIRQQFKLWADKEKQIKVHPRGTD